MKSFAAVALLAVGSVALSIPPFPLPGITPSFKFAAPGSTTCNPNAPEFYPSPGTCYPKTLYNYVDVDFALGAIDGLLCNGKS
jgi:hypothetical protein